MRSMIIAGSSKFLGKTLEESGIRHIFNCMVVGLEEGKENLSQVSPSYKFQKGDVIWVVGEVEDLDFLLSPEGRESLILTHVDGISEWVDKLIEVS